MKASGYADSEGPDQTARMYPINIQQRPGWDLAHVQNDVNPHILRMLEGTFRLARSKCIISLYLIL